MILVNLIVFCVGYNNITVIIIYVTVRCSYRQVEFSFKQTDINCKNFESLQLAYV